MENTQSFFHLIIVNIYRPLGELGRSKLMVLGGKLRSTAGGYTFLAFKAISIVVIFIFLSICIYEYCCYKKAKNAMNSFEWNSIGKTSLNPSRGIEMLAISSKEGVSNIPPFPEKYLEILNKLAPFQVVPGQGFGVGEPDEAKVILIGIDGATWKVLNPLLERGLLPNFQRLLEKSSYGNLQTDEAFSPVSWTSIATGKSRIKAFHKSDNRTLWGADTSVVRVKRFWDILAGPGGEGCALVNYYFTPQLLDFPKATIVENQFRSPWTTDIFKNNDLLRAWIHFTSTTSASQEILANMNVRVFASIESESDWMQHESLFYFLLSLLPEFEHFTPASKHSNSLLHGRLEEKAQKLVRIYLQNDQLIGLLLDSYPNDYIFIVSDHGFHVKSPILHLDIPYLISGPDAELFFRSHNFPDFRSSGDKIIPWSDQGYDYLAQRKTQKYAFKLFVDEKTGETIYIKVYLYEYSFSSKKTKGISHLSNYLAKIIKSNDSLMLEQKDDTITIKIKGDLIDLAASSFDLIDNHDSNDPGIFIIAGPHIAKAKIENAHLYDITPTILYLKGMPIGKDMDGKVLFDIIDPAYVKTHPASFIVTHETDRNTDIDKPTPPLSNKPLSAEKKELLKSLGYL